MVVFYVEFGCSSIECTHCVDLLGIGYCWVPPQGCGVILIENPQPPLDVVVLAADFLKQPIISSV